MQILPHSLKAIDYASWTARRSTPGACPRCGMRPFVAAPDPSSRDPRRSLETVDRVVAALKKGAPIHIGEVPGDSPAAPEPEVSSDPEPEVPAAKRAEAVERRKAAQARQQAERERIYRDGGIGTVKVRDTATGRVLQATLEKRWTERVPVRIFTEIPEFRTQYWTAVVVFKGKTFHRWRFCDWKGAYGGKGFNTARRYELVREEDIARLRAKVSELHPDKGGPGGEAFRLAKEELDAVLGRR